MTRQNYYKQRRAREQRKVDEDFVIALVERERRLQPRLGGRKLHHMLSDEWKEAGTEIGRDRLFELLGRHDLLVKPLPKRPRTTDSRHALPVFRNLISELTPLEPHQVWVVDLTYLRTDEGFIYLGLIMDLCSRKIIGYHCGEDLCAFGCVQALKQALAQLPADHKPIHHSDRGCQYCSHEYVYHLQNRGLSISMTEENHCYENAYAERLNGILKQEYGLGMNFRCKQHAHRATEQAVMLYNTKRPHTSLNYKTPEEAHELFA